MVRKSFQALALLTSSVHEADSNPVQELGLELVGR